VNSLTPEYGNIVATYAALTSPYTVQKEYGQVLSYTEKAAAIDGEVFRLTHLDVIRIE
jgi:hypothetical protein